MVDALFDLTHHSSRSSSNNAPDPTCAQIRFPRAFPFLSQADMPRACTLYIPSPTVDTRIRDWTLDNETNDDTFTNSLKEVLSSSFFPLSVLAIIADQHKLTADATSFNLQDQEIFTDYYLRLHARGPEDCFGHFGFLC